MPDPISPFHQALRLLKAELAQARSSKPGTLPAAAPTRVAGAVQSAGRTVPGTALQGLPAKLRALAAQHAGRPEKAKALRLFLEAVLVDEFGAELQLDAAFHDLVERVGRAIESDPGSAALLDEALVALEALAR